MPWSIILPSYHICVLVALAVLPTLHRLGLPRGCPFGVIPCIGRWDFLMTFPNGEVECSSGLSLPLTASGAGLVSGQSDLLVLAASVG